MKKKKKRYVGDGVKLFIGFLPDEIYCSFSEEETLNYREYRRYQRFIGESELRVKKYQKEIDRLTIKISDEKKKVKGFGDEDGWEKRMEFYYNKVSHLDKDLKLNCSVEIRNRTSASKRVEDGEINRSLLERQKTQHKGKKLSNHYKVYGRVENLSNRKQFYFGDEYDIRSFLEGIYKEDWSKDDFESVKDELKSMMSQFSRYHIFKSNWADFKVGTYNMQTLVNWCKWCEENGVDRYEWGGHR
jgi:hypothetical protein